MTVQRIDRSRKRFLGTRGIPCIDTVSRNLLPIGLLFATFVFQRTASMPSSLTIRSADDDNGFVFPGTESPWRTTENEERTIKRETSREGNDVEPTGNIVFPTDDSEPRLNIFTPGPAPECRTKTYCEKTDFYPSKYVSNVIRKHDDLKILAGVDEVEGVVQRIGDDSVALCASEERLVYPTAAQNRENNWLFVLNQENFKQGVRIETCLSTESECSVISGFVEGYKSMCKQKYILRQLAAISPNGTAIRDMFRLPSSCCCHVKFEGLYNRLGLSLKSKANNQTPAPNTRRRRNTSNNN